MKNKFSLIIAFLVCGWVFYASFKGNGKGVKNTADAIMATKAQDKRQCTEAEHATGEFSIINLLFSLIR
ncbi:MAG: hypothetical protein JST58_04735 [Bacteroidetes bacterium]|jgi:hypothetical protein|nr:hypothetical protein [Bacteroidota bacterium]